MGDYLAPFAHTEYQKLVYNIYSTQPEHLTAVITRQLLSLSVL